MLWLNENTAMAGLWYYAHGGASGRSPANGAYSQWGYDALQRVSWVQHNAAGTAADLFLYFGYNPANQIASRTQSNDAYAWTGAYTVNRAYQTNGLNQYTAAGTATFTYDANGNLTSDGSAAFTYDIENRLVAASGARTAGLRYDPLGRLYEVTPSTGSGGSGTSGTTRFLYDGDALVGEYNAAGTLLRRYVHWGAGADVPYLWYEGAGLDSPHYLSADQQGSIVLATDAAGHPVINSYDEYGIPGTGNTGRFQYTGQAWLSELGMYHYKARVYSPTLGRFLQTDPVGYKDQFNLYAYVANDPANATDPTGTELRWEYRNGGTSQQGTQARDYLMRSETFRDNYRFLRDSPAPSLIIVDPTTNTSTLSDNTLIWNPTHGAVDLENRAQSPALGLGHDIDHLRRQVEDRAQYDRDESTPSPLAPPGSPLTWTVNEDKATEATNQMARDLGEPTVRNYGDNRGVVIIPDDTRRHSPPN